MRKFTVTGGILKRPITVIMITLVIIGFGVYSLSELQVTLYPSFNIPILAISTGYNNVAPQDMTQLIVKPIEGAVSSVEGIDELESNISKGNAFIILHLKNGTDIRETELKVRQAISRIRSDLPDEAQDPVIFQFDPNNFPIMRLSLKSSNRGLDELRELGTDFVEPRIERLPGVASADTRGGLERKIFINIDPMALAQYNMVPSDLEQALRNNNTEIPTGSIITGQNSFSVHAESMYQNVDQIRQTIIKMADSSNVPIRVKDVADVEDSFADITTLVEINGKNSVSVEVQKKSDSNTLDVTEAVVNELSDINSNLPPGVSLNVLTNDGDNVQNSISNLSQSALAALVVVVIVLLIFMGGWRISMVVAVTIPLSVTASFAAMYAAGLTLNVLTITALALAIGLLVDNAIVVSESIARKLEEGISKFQATLEGTNEVIGALLGATLTTLGVFLPIVGVSGVQGQFFYEFAVTISIAIAISFVASIVLVPVMAMLLLKESSFEKERTSSHFIKKMENAYARSLRWLMFRKWIALVFVIAIIGGSYVIYQNLQSEFMPQSDSGNLTVRVELPSGTELAKTALAMRNFSNRLQKMNEVKTVVTKIGQRGYRSQTNIGEITVTLVKQDERDVSTNQFAANLRNKFQMPGVHLNIRSSGGGRNFGGGGSSIRLSLFGADVDVLKGISDKIETVMLQDSSVISVDNGRTEPTPELQYKVDRQRISRTGVSLLSVGQSLKSQMQGTRVGYFRDEDRQIPIEVRTPKNLIHNRQELADLNLIQSNGQRVPAGALGKFESAKGLSQIERRDRETVLDVNINVNGNASKYRDKIINTIKKQVAMPDGYRYEFTGSTRNAQEGTSEIMWALLGALLLTYMIMASLFENFSDPFIIFFTIPLAFFGAFAGLFIFNTPIGATAYIGIFILVGIIVNNGIVLVDYMHIYTTYNEVSDSLFNNVIEACKRRMRPILLTALTTVCSMIPLALGFGTGADIWAPLARAVIGGLTFGSILTLYVIPVFVMGSKKERRKLIRQETSRQNEE